MRQPEILAKANAYANQAMLSSTYLGYQVYSIPQGQQLIGMDGKLNPNATLGYSDGTYYYTPDNWLDEIFGKLTCVKSII